MSQALRIYRIRKRTGITGIPRQLIPSSLIRIERDEKLENVARRTLTQVKRMVAKDGRDRQINVLEVTPRRSGVGHNITDRVWRRVYHSESDGLVHVYAGEGQRARRWGQPAGTIESRLVSVG